MKAFSVERHGDDLVIAAAAYHRYDAFADAVGSVNVSRLLGVYRAMHGELEAAYRALGYPRIFFDKIALYLLRRIAGAPAPKGDVAVEQTNGMYVFKDARLEKLGAFEKHLIRMGPRNMRIIQNKAREILDQLSRESR